MRVSRTPSFPSRNNGNHLAEIFQIGSILHKCRVTVHRLTDFLSASMPSPPPPYSPSVQQALSQTVRTSPLTGNHGFSPSTTVSPSANSPEYRTPVSAATTVSPAPFTNSEIRSASYARGLPPTSPQVTSALTFPPPPPKANRDRSSSRTRPDRSHNFFGLSALTSRSRTNENIAPSSSAITSQRKIIDNAPGTPSQGVTTLHEYVFH